MSDNKPFPNRAHLQPRLQWGVANGGYMIAAFITERMAQGFVHDCPERDLEVVKVQPNFLRMPAVQQRIGNLSRAWIYAKVAKGEFPAPIHLGSATSVVWLEHEIDEWVRKMILARGDLEGDEADEARVNP